MSGTPDITIIGGGIIGLLTARELSIAGANVTIIEKNKLGRESSWAGGGILLPLYPWRQDRAISALVLHSLNLYPDLSCDLLNATGIDPEWIDCGLLITRNPDFESATQWCRSNRIHFEKPDPSRLACFSTIPLNPLWLQDIAQVRNPRLITALIKDLETRNVDFIENCELNKIEYRHSRIQSVITSTGKLPINSMIIAAGAWSGELWSRLFASTSAVLPEINPVKGQMLLFDTEPGLLTHMILDDDQYLIPRRDGKILAGSTVEDRGFCKSTTQEAKQRLESFALNLFPALKSFPLKHHWAGLRPGTKHGIPYIGKHPGINNLSINAGHFRNGLAMGPASAKLLVDILQNRPAEIDPEPYKIDALH